MSRYIHQPVLVKEIIRYLVIKKDGIYVDCTAGEGGHSEAILKELEKDGRLIGIDWDFEVLQIANKRFEGHKNWISFNENFINIHKVLDILNIKAIDGVLFDLGVSSFQLENHKRGFSFTREGPLDMRMSTEKGDSPIFPSEKLEQSPKLGQSPRARGLRAWDLVNKLSFGELRKIIREYGEEFHASKIAGAIVSRRRKKTIDTTTELCRIMEGAVPRRSKIHPATRTFQALRIAVNNELENLRKGLQEAIGVLAPGGRICVISFHSLEDRIVKNTFRSSLALEVITKKPVIPLQAEVKINPRSRSAKLRVAEKRGEK